MIYWIFYSWEGTAWSKMLGRIPWSHMGRRCILGVLRLGLIPASPGLARRSAWQIWNGFVKKSNC